MKIYLSGPIYPPGTCDNDRVETDKWRHEATELLQRACHPIGLSSEFMSTLDPCRKKAIYDPKLFTPNEIVFRDLKDVDEADLVLVNFNLLPNKLPIGTVMEIQHAWETKKPVVVVSTDPRIINHPWIIAMSVRIFGDLKEACDYIVEFWT